MAVRPEELAETLRRRQRAEHGRWNDESRRRRLAVRAVVSALLTEGIVEKVWLIGSLAWGQSGPGSDVDLVVEGLDRSEFAQTWSRLESAISASVDLLRLEELPPDFRQRVLREGERLDVG